MVKESKTALKNYPNLKLEVYQLVKKIPKGKIATYGQIAKKFQIDPRMVGWMLHANHDLNVPCHRVVDRNGRIAPNFAGPQLPGAKANGRRAFGGWKKHKKKLESENVKFRDKMHVDLEKYLWSKF